MVSDGSARPRKPSSSVLAAAGLRVCTPPPKDQGGVELDCKADGPGGHGVTLADLKNAIAELYREKQPERLDGINDLLQTYKGAEQSLYLRLCSRYGCEPRPALVKQGLEVTGVLLPSGPQQRQDLASSKPKQVPDAKGKVQPMVKSAYSGLQPSNAEQPSFNPEGGESSVKRTSCTAPGTGSDWFSDLFGFTECGYSATQRRLKVVPFERALEGENGVRYQIGRFWTPSLLELEALATKEGCMAKLNGRLRVRNVMGDVAEFHAAENNKHATFQVASQFNCLEFTGPNKTPEHGITGYAGDKTQGPACSIACGPATAYRNYFVDVNGNTGQQRNHQINNLSDLNAKLGNTQGKYFKVVGGYTMAEDTGLRELNTEISKMDERTHQSFRKSLRIGVHEDVQVTSTAWGMIPVRKRDHTVTQVFGSACSVSYSGNGKQLWAPFARLVLSASYEATLWAALLNALRHKGEHGSRRVFLTCVGGGVFGNDLQWIASAMEEAFTKLQDMDLEIFIVTYSGPIPEPLQALERRF